MLTAPDYINGGGYALLIGSDPYTSQECVAFLRHAGLELSRAGAAHVDVVEDQGFTNRELTVNEFGRYLDEREDAWFRAWSGSGRDMLCSLMKRGNTWVEHYVVGYLHRESEHLTTLLFERFLADIGSGQERLIVVDWGAEADNTNWIDLWLEKCDLADPFPDVLGLPRRLQRRIHDELAGYGVRFEGGHVVIARNGVLGKTAR